MHIAAPSKEKLHFVVHDLEPGYDTYTEKPGYSWDADVAFADVDPSQYAPKGKALLHTPPWSRTSRLRERSL